MRPSRAAFALPLAVSAIEHNIDRIKFSAPPSFPIQSEYMPPYATAVSDLVNLPSYCPPIVTTPVTTAQTPPATVGPRLQPRVLWCEFESRYMELPLGATPGPDTPDLGLKTTRAVTSSAVGTLMAKLDRESNVILEKAAIQLNSTDQLGGPTTSLTSSTNGPWAIPTSCRCTTSSERPVVCGKPTSTSELNSSSKLTSIVTASSTAGLTQTPWFTVYCPLKKDRSLLDESKDWTVLKPSEKQRGCVAMPSCFDQSRHIHDHEEPDGQKDIIEEELSARSGPSVVATVWCSSTRCPDMLKQRDGCVEVGKSFEKERDKYVPDQVRVRMYHATTMVTSIKTIDNVSKPSVIGAATTKPITTSIKVTVAGSNATTITKPTTTPTKVTIFTSIDRPFTLPGAPTSVTSPSLSSTSKTP